MQQSVTMQPLMGKWIWLMLLGTAPPSTQTVFADPPKITASLVIPKTQYLVGEPIEVSFIARPKGHKAANLSQSDSYGQCSEYTVSVQPDAPIQEPTSGPLCAPFFSITSIECLTGGLELEPDKDTHDEVLLNYFYDFSKSGTYQVTVKRWISNFADFGKLKVHAREISAHFTITVVPWQEQDDLRPLFSRYIANLTSKNWSDQYEAVRVVSFMPQPFLEPSLIQMLKSNGNSYWGVEGLRRLNSENSRETLFQFVGNPEKDFSFEQEAALEALQEMGDATFGVRLLERFQQSRNASNKAKLLKAAARLDPAHSLPLIQPLLTSSSDEDRQAGVDGLAAIELPDALPALVKMLHDPTKRVREKAAQGLVSLTRESPAKDSGLWWSDIDPANDIPFWTAWLKSHPDLPIHLMRDCPQSQRR